MDGPSLQAVHGEQLCGFTLGHLQVPEAFCNHYSSSAVQPHAGLAEFEYKTNRVSCSVVNEIVKAYEANATTKFVLKLKGRGIVGEFAVSHTACALSHGFDHAMMRSTREQLGKPYIIRFPWQPGSSTAPAQSSKLCEHFLG
jgi:hypothetical protein